MTTESATKLMTADELLRLGDDVRGELIKGEFREVMSAGGQHGKAAMNLGIELGVFVKRRRLGTTFAAETGFWLERGPDTVRAPDLAFTSAERLPLDDDTPGYLEVVPDLVAEVRSPNDSRREVRAKAEMWLSHGVRLVWVVHPDTRTIDVYRADAPVATLAEDAALDGGDVLPGFTCPVRAVFEA